MTVAELGADPVKIIRSSFWLLGMMISLGGSASSAVFAPMTLIPDSSASKACMLGYRAHCSFTPFSTLILVALALLLGYGVLLLWRRKPFRIPSIAGMSLGI